MLGFAVPTIVASLVLLAVRLVLVVTFVAEAKVKFKDIKDFAKNDSIPVPLAYVVAGAELAAAISMLTGIMAQWAGVGLVLLMLITMSFHWFKWRSPYWANKGGWEYDLLMLVLAAVVIAFGPGQLVIF